MPSPAPVARLEWLARIAVDPDASKGAVAIAAALAIHPTAPGGDLYPSVPGLAQRAMLTRRGAQKAIAALVELGYLAVEQGGGRGFKNSFRIVETANGCSPICVLETMNDGSPISSEKGEPQGLKGRTVELQTANHRSPEPGIEPGIEPGRSDGNAFDLARWKRRAGAFGKGTAQRAEAVARLHDAGASETDFSTLFARLPAPGTLGKAEAAALFDNAVETLVEELSAIRTEKARAQAEAARRKRLADEQAARDAKDAAERARANRPASQFLTKAMRADLWCVNPKIEGQLDLNELVISIRDGIDVASISFDQAMGALAEAEASPSINERIAILRKISIGGSNVAIAAD